MEPLIHSWAATELEDEMRKLFIELYKDAMADKADEINVYGVPHIGPFSLVEREVAKDGLAVLRTTDEAAIRYLFEAWRFRNPRRGMHFLRTYLQALFGSSFNVSQLWQEKAMLYPLSLRASSEIQGTPEERNYYLTSRIRVDIDTDFVPARLEQVLRTTVAARFVMDVRTAKYGKNTLGNGLYGGFGYLFASKNVNYPLQWTSPDGGAPAVGFGRVSVMLADLWGYLQRSTGAAADEAEMPMLTTAEGLVKNNQFVGGALGGYTADGVASSEGISLMMRGIAHAYEFDKDPTKLEYLKFLMDACCDHFFFGTRPTADASLPWYHSWMVNAGVPFSVRGPLAENGQLDQGGYIGIPVEFVNGECRLTPVPDIVYQVATVGSTFVWHNVFSEIEPGTGSRVEVDYYINTSGNKVYGVQTGGSFGQPSEALSLEVPGKIVLKEPLNGTFLISYSVTVPTTTIEYGEAYEAWPMWRKLAQGERSMAADAMHWWLDAFRHLMASDPTNQEWANAHARMLDVWTKCCDQESNNTKIFVSGASGPYNNFPLTYSFAYGVNNVDDAANTRWALEPPNSHYTALRTEDGYVTFTSPTMNSAIGSGGPVRYGVVFENKPLYLEYTPKSKFLVDTSCTLDTVVTMSITSAAGFSHHAALLCSPTSGFVSLGIDQFLRFAIGNDEAPRWIPGEKIYGFNAGVSQKIEYLETSTGKTLMAGTYVVPDRDSGFGVTFDMTSPNLILSVPPKICYRSSSDFTLTLKDANSWLWSAPAPRQTALAERSWVWADFVLSAYQEPSKDGVTRPVSPVGTIQVFQFTGAQGAHGEAGNIPQSISLAYISGVTPTSATSGDIRIVRLLNPNPNANTWKVGNVSLESGARREIKYFGTLPFGLMIGGPSRARLAVIPFRGPYIAGYQSGTPWVDAANAGALEQMLDFMIESQDQFTARSPSALIGPFMHTYLPATWDSEQYGTLDTWVWDGPDGNPAWNGWQYRAFDAMSRTWAQSVSSSMSPLVTEKAELVATRFLRWINDWIEANPKAYYIPSVWGPIGWKQGEPLPPNSYLEPRGESLEAHDLALVLKGAIFCAKAGADRGMCVTVIERCLLALSLAQVHGVSDPMRGCFTLKPADFESYSFHQGEIMDALALAALNQDLLPESARDATVDDPAFIRITEDGFDRAVQSGDNRLIE